MSDDFDKDDFSWLQGDDEENTPPGDDDALRFDWQKDRDDSAPGDSQRLGLTGELPWLQDEPERRGGDNPQRLGMTGELPWFQGGADDDTAADDEDMLDWMAEVDLPESDAEDGPDWLRGADHAPASDWMQEAAESFEDDLTGDAPGDDAPDWLQGADEPDFEESAPDWLMAADALFDDDEPQASADDDEEDVPDWLGASSGWGADDEPAPPRARPAADDLPDWMRTDTSSLRAEAPPEEPPVETGLPEWARGDTSQFENDPLDDVPDWLQGLDAEAPPAPRDLVDETGQLSDSWLAQGADLPASAESDVTFDEWMLLQAEAEREPELDELIPDAFVEIEAAAGEPADTGALPDWFLGMDELDPSEAPDWFADEPDPTQPNSPTEPRPEGLAEAVELDDFFSTVDVDELPLAEEEAPADLSALFAGADEEEDEQAEPVADFSALFDEDAPDWMQDELPEAEEAPADFGALFDEDAPDWMQAEPEPAEVPADFSALFGGDDEETPDWMQAEPEFADMSADTLLDDDLPEPTFDDFGDSFFSNLAPVEAEADSPRDLEPLDDSFFASLGLGDEDEPQAAPQFDEPQAEAADTFDMSFFDTLEPAAEPQAAFDWFAEEEAPVEEPDDGDWLSALPDLDDMPAEDDAFPDFAYAETPAAPAPVDDIDSILAAIDRVDAVLPDSGELGDGDVDFDSLLSDPAFADVAPEIDPERPGWLTEVGATVGATSAAALLRQQRDRPLDELPDRLRRLREKSESIADAPAPAAGGSPLETLLPGVADALAPTTFQIDSEGLPSGVNISAEQEKRVQLLRSLMGDSSRAALTEADAAAPSRRRIQWDRLLVTLIVAAAVILPFLVADLRLGNPPPAQFAANSPEQAFFDTVAALPADSLVLVGVEYGPTAAGELDSLTSVILRHVLQSGARPVIVSGNPIALLRVENMLAAPLTPQAESAVLVRALRPNEDYYIVRYLPGGNLGLRTLAVDFDTTASIDSRGRPTGLTNMGRVSAVLVIAERVEDFRSWAEQVAPLLPDVPFLGATGRGTALLVNPYLGASLDGLLVGYQDALTYDTLLQDDPVVIVPEEPTEETPTEPTAEASPTSTPSSTPSPVPPTATPSVSGVITASGPINLREGPGSSFGVVASLDPGTGVLVLGAEEGWVNVRVPGGVEGWIAANLIAIEGESAAASETPTTAASNTPTPTTAASNTPAPSVTPTTAASNTPAPSATPTTAGPTNTPPPTETPVQTVITARVIATDPINVRSGPGTSFAPVGVARPGDELVVVGRNGAGDWIQVEFEGAEEAWIAAFLLEISAEEAPATSGLLLVRGGGLVLRPYQQADATVTPDVIETVPVTENAPDGLARWYSMTLGLVAIIAVIVLGALVNIGRSLLRRRG